MQIERYVEWVEETEEKEDLGLWVANTLVFSVHVTKAAATAFV